MNAPLLRSRTALLIPPLLGALLLAGAAFAEPNIVDQVLAQCGDRPYTYDEVMAWLTRLEASDRVSVVPIGRSVGGRTIPLVALYHPRTVYGQTMRLFVIARQHGSEEAGTEAAMAILNYLVRSNAPQDLALLQRVTFVIVPVANPDGAVADRRANGAGLDLNRDWAGLTQPETRAIDWAFRVWQPHSFIDCHELPAHSSKEAFQENFLQTIADDPALNPIMTQWCTTLSDAVRRYEVAYGFRLNAYYDSHNEDRRLAHRRFGLDYQVPSFLFESKMGEGRSLRDRVRFHVVAALVIANLLAQQAPVPKSVAPLRPPPIMVPPGPAQPPVKRPSAPAETLVRFTSPTGDRETFSDAVPLGVQVVASQEFSYLSVRVDGILRSLSDAPEYERSLSVDSFEAGQHTIVCQAHDGSGRVLAEARRIVLVEKNVAGQ